MANSPNSIPDSLHQPFVALLLSIADEKFFLGHRNSDWTGLGPFLEEDIAFCNIAQDEIAHAQELYKLAAAFTNPRADVIVEANRLAYARPAKERLHANLVELVDDYNWAIAVARQFFYDRYDLLRLPRLAKSTYQPLAELAGKMLQEISFHVQHFDAWIEKLAGGTEESRRKLQLAVELLWPHALGLFVPPPDQEQLVEAGIYAGDDAQIRQEWLAAVGARLAGAGLQVPTESQHSIPGGRAGNHTADLDDLLTDLTEVYSCEPHASW